MTPAIALTNALSTLLLAEEQGELTQASKAAALGQIDRARRALQSQSVEGEASAAARELEKQHYEWVSKRQTSLAELVRQGRIPGHEPDDMFNGFA